MERNLVEESWNQVLKDQLIEGEKEGTIEEYVKEDNEVERKEKGDGLACL